MTNLIEKTPSFNPEASKPGSLIILTDYNGRVFGSGVVIETSPILLKIVIWSNHLESQFSDMEVIPYDLTIEAITSQKVKIIIIDPHYPETLIIGEEE